MTAPDTFHMNQQARRTLQDHRTPLAPADVIARAKVFFSEQNGVYSAFFEKEGPTYVTFRGQGGEEIVIGTSPIEGGTLVSGSTYLFDVQVARFFATLPPYVEPEPSLEGAVPHEASPPEPEGAS